MQLFKNLPQFFRAICSSWSSKVFYESRINTFRYRIELSLPPVFVTILNKLHYNNHMTLDWRFRQCYKMGFNKHQDIWASTVYKSVIQSASFIRVQTAWVFKYTICAPWPLSYIWRLLGGFIVLLTGFKFITSTIRAQIVL